MSSAQHPSDLARQTSYVLAYKLHKPLVGSSVLATLGFAPSPSMGLSLKASSPSQTQPPGRQTSFCRAQQSLAAKRNASEEEKHNNNKQGRGRAMSSLMIQPSPQPVAAHGLTVPLPALHLHHHALHITGYVLGSWLQFYIKASYCGRRLWLNPF